MSAPSVIDSGEFARSGQELRGSVEVDSLKRLEDVLYDTEGKLDYSVGGSRDKRNRPRIDVRVAGHLHLQCQRCLGLLEHEVTVDSSLLLIEPGAPQDPELDDPEGPDALETSAELDVMMLVEDEVLLSLPISPRHAEGECVSRIKDARTLTNSQSAFAQLDALKGSRTRD
jgi:uncharacterized protein